MGKIITVFAETFVTCLRKKNLRFQLKSLIIDTQKYLCLSDLANDEYKGKFSMSPNITAKEICVYKLFLTPPLKIKQMVM